MFNTGLSACYNVADLRKRAKRRLPKAMFGYLDGFAEDGVAGKRNRSAFDRIELVPRVLVDVADTDISTTILGQHSAAPVICAPVALPRLFHDQGELASARAAGEAGIIFTLSTLASIPMETVAQEPGPKWFQLYMYRDKGLVKELVDRAKDSGYSALCLTVDAFIGGNREQDLRNGFSVPPHPSLKTILETTLHPAWCWDYLTKPKVTTANVSGDRIAGSEGKTTLLEYVTKQLTPSVTWNDVVWLREQFDGPLLIKGVLCAEDAERAVQSGVDGLVLSNHGGRQLDHTVAPIDILPEIVDCVGDSLEIVIDSGIRRGTDVIKAVALGAKACMIGRPYIYGLSAAGQAGVQRALGLICEEVVRDMQLLGCRSMAELNRDYVRVGK